jgi:hypothetical protein
MHARRLDRTPGGADILPVFAAFFLVYLIGGLAIAALLRLNYQSRIFVQPLRGKPGRGGYRVVRHEDAHFSP